MRPQSSIYHRSRIRTKNQVKLNSFEEEEQQNKMVDVSSFLFLSQCLLACGTTRQTNISRTLVKYQVVPDVIDVPAELLIQVESQIGIQLRIYSK